jgi:hypothetical protein
MRLVEYSPSPYLSLILAVIGILFVLSATLFGDEDEEQDEDHDDEIEEDEEEALWVMPGPGPVTVPA